MMKVTADASCSKGRPCSGPPGRARGRAAGAEAQTTQKRELVTAQGGDISKFDPHFSTTSNDIRVSFNLFDNLTSRHPDGKLYPGLATEWKLQGQTTWRSSSARASSSTTAIPSPRPTPSAASSGPTIPPPRPWWPRSSPPSIGSRRRTPSRSSSTPRSPTRSCRPARLLRRPDRAEEVPGVGRQRDLQRQAGGHGPGPLRVVGEGRQGRSSTPTATTGAAGSTSTAGSCGPSPRRRRASPRCSRARWTSSPSSRPIRPSA